MSYALVQKSLDHKIDPKVFEEASVHAPSIARADCARLRRKLFGVVVSNLPYDEALAFQTALDYFGFPTEIVPQQNLPVLPDPAPRRGIRFENDSFASVDGLGREYQHSLDDVLFAGGGFIQQLKLAFDRRFDWHSMRDIGISPATRSIQVVKTATDVTEIQFRMELILATEPFRLQFKADKESVFRYDGDLIHFRENDRYIALLGRVAGFLPPNFLSLGMRAAASGDLFLYPCAGALEEEIIWHLLQRH